MLCNHCGENLPEGKKFCPSCGQSVTGGNMAAQSEKKKKSPLKNIACVVGGFFAFSIVLAMFSGGDTTSTPSGSENSGNSGNSTNQNNNSEGSIASPEIEPEPEMTNTKEYEPIEYETLLRGGHDWLGKEVKFEGIVTQVLYDTGFSNTVFDAVNSGTFCNIVLDTNFASYEEKLVVGLYVIPEGEPRLLTGDYVTMYGTFLGVDQFEMASGAPESFPVLDVQVAKLTSEDEPSHNSEESSEILEYSSDFNPVLEKIIIALENKEGFSELSSKDLSELFFYNTVETIGYAYKDINGDGTEELLIGELGRNSGTLVALYYMTENGAKLALNGGERESYTLCNDGLIAYIGSSGADNTASMTFELSPNGLTMVSDSRVKDSFNLTDEFIPDYLSLASFP